eukprot:3641211-Alexandrium_andersonii.AAC.1
MKTTTQLSETAFWMHGHFHPDRDMPHSCNLTHVHVDARALQTCRRHCWFCAIGDGHFGAPKSGLAATAARGRPLGNA